MHYLNATRDLARARVAKGIADIGFRAEELLGVEELIVTDVPTAAYVDVVTAEGVAAVGLPASYPFEADGTIVPHATCGPIGEAAYAAAERGIACRSVVLPQEEELALFEVVGLTLVVRQRLAFRDWFPRGRDVTSAT